MRTARQISAQAKKKGVILPVVKPIVVTKLVAPNARIAEKLAEENMKAKDKPVVNHVLDTTKGFYVDERKKYLIINANGYTVEQLSKELPDRDIEYIEQDIKIPLNYGMGVEVIHDNKQFIFKRGGSWNKPVVTLEITTWKGISSGAMHYYGKLNIKLPEMTQVDANMTTSSNFFIPMYENHTIELTQELEQWEIDKYKDNYRHNSAGDRHHGFYTKKQLTEYGRLVFDQIFEKGWIFKIDD